MKLLGSNTFSGVIQIVFLSLVFWLVGQFGFLSSINGWIYELTSYLSVSPAVSDRVLIVNVADEHDHPDYWNLLLDKLEAYQPTEIVLPYPAINTPKNRQSLIYGQALSEQSNNISEGVRTVANDIPRPELGIYRYYDLSAFQGSSLNHLGKTLTQAVRPDISLPERFMLSPRLFEEGLPQVNSEALVKNRVHPKLVAGKLVFLQRQPDKNLPGIHISILHGELQLSATEYHALGVHTLLSEQGVKPIHSLVLVLLLVFYGLVCLIIYRNAPKGDLLISCLILMITLAVLQAAKFFLLWCPPAELFLLQVSAAIISHRLRLNQEKQSVDNFLLVHQTLIKKHIHNTSFLDTDEHWNQLIALVNQTLQLNRLIFLERIKGDHRVREVASLHCSINDIKEMRRDYERTPYSTAIELNQPLLLDRPYLEHAPENEQQVLVPLVFVGEVMGFWAFGIQKDTLAEISGFTSIVDDYGKQIAELLYHRQQWQQDKEKKSRFFYRYLSLRHTSVRFRQLKQFIESQHRRQALYEGLLESSHNAVLLYDLFGRVTIINPTMEALLQENDLPPFELTALDMLTRLTKIEPGHSRQLLQEVIQQERDLTLLVDLADAYYELKVSALLVKEEQELGYNSSEPFSVQGILFELKEMRSAKEKEQYHARLVKHLFHLIQNDLESIYMATSLLEQDVSLEEKQYLSDTLKEKKNNLNEILKRAWHFLQQADVVQSANAQYPLDTCIAIEKAIEAYRRGIPANKRVRFEYQFIEYSELGMADPSAIPVLIDLLLEALLDDATDDSVISIQFQEREKHLVYRFSNQGFGMPQERLDDLLQGSDQFNSDVFQQLSRMQHQVQQWGGQLICRSQLGKGMEFLLVFKRFI